MTILGDLLGQYAQVTDAGDELAVLVLDHDHPAIHDPHGDHRNHQKDHQVNQGPVARPAGFLFELHCPAPAIAIVSL